jgi:hypothetical protein
VHILLLVSPPHKGCVCVLYIDQFAQKFIPLYCLGEKTFFFYLTDHIVKRMFTVDERFSNSLSTPAGVDYITLVRHK